MHGDQRTYPRRINVRTARKLDEDFFVPTGNLFRDGTFKLFRTVMIHITDNLHNADVPAMIYFYVHENRKLPGQRRSIEIHLNLERIRRIFSLDRAWKNSPVYAMCCFSRNVSVNNTRIFARASSMGQFLVYSMDYTSKEDMAMILPLPVPPHPGENAVRFIDLSAYPEFFTNMENGFPQSQFLGLSRAVPAGAPALKVHDVGSYEASFVPSQTDFSRLEERFRIPGEFWSQLPIYADCGFAVFKLKSGDKKVHPMAFDFQTRHRDSLFFPTVHIHNMMIEKDARFDHFLYFQGKRISECENTGIPAGAFMDIVRCSGIVDAEDLIQKKRLYGILPNQDTILN